MERTDLTQGIRDVGPSLSPDYTRLISIRNPSFCWILSALGELWAGAAVQWLGLCWAAVGHVFSDRGGEGSSWNPAKPCCGTATAEQELCRAAPHSHCLSTFLYTLPVPAVTYGSKEITLLSKGRKEKQVFLLAKMFVLTCILKSCTAQSRCALGSQHCCLKQPRGQSYTCIQAADKSPIIELHHFWFMFFYMLHSGIQTSLLPLLSLTYCNFPQN